LGKYGENVAVSFLKKHGYKILCKNYKNKLGEIDIIARDKDTLCFVEVKTRRTDRFGAPQEAISYSKQKKISQVALIFLKENHLLDQKARFDVVSLMGAPGESRLELFKNAFQLEQNYAY